MTKGSKLIRRICICSAKVLLAYWCTVVVGDVVQKHPSARQAIIFSDCPKTLTIYWKNHETNETVELFDIRGGGQNSVNTYVGHMFVVKQNSNASEGALNSTLAHSRSVCSPEAGPVLVCEEKEKENDAIGFFTIRADDDVQEFYIESDLTIEYRKASSVPVPTRIEYFTVEAEEKIEDRDSLEEGASFEPRIAPLSTCRETLVDSLMSPHGVGSSPPTPSSALDVLGTYTHCLKKNVAGQLQTLKIVNHDEEKKRRTLAANLEGYTCADKNLPTSPPIYATTWTSERSGVTREVNVLHERPRSKIHVIPNFISEEECAAIEKAAQPTLHKATVADGKGGSQYSPNRKAMQAGVKVPWQMEEEGDPIAALSRRVLDYSNYVLGLDLKEHGQEDLMSIQYFGRGIKDSAPDQYMPHCDGDCSGLKHKTGGRVSTMVMYCTAPERGGSTNFRNAGVHVAPQKGAAAFFASIGGADDLVMDNGYTEHSGCPVLLGEKKIAVQWLRLGVDEENPWDSFNTLTVKACDQD